MKGGRADERQFDELRAMYRVRAEAGRKVDRVAEKALRRAGLIGLR